MLRLPDCLPGSTSLSRLPNAPLVHDFPYHKSVLSNHDHWKGYRVRVDVTLYALVVTRRRRRSSSIK